jgi:poly(3-hydroxybutyrate) depolymerase
MLTAGGWGGAPEVDSIIHFRSELNECQTIDTAEISANTMAYYHRNGIDGNEVWYYKINNHSHQWPGENNDASGIDANKVIWKIFMQY